MASFLLATLRVVANATLKNVPYIFLWRAIPGRHPNGPSQATLKNVPYVFLWRNVISLLR
nr:hypothetical protein B7L52_01870 [Pectobacterium carotovorum]